MGRKGWADFYLSNAIFCQSLQQQYIGTNLRRKRASHMQGPIFRSHALRVWLLELRMSLLACDCQHVSIHYVYRDMSEHLGHAIL